MTKKKRLNQFYIVDFKPVGYINETTKTGDCAEYVLETENPASFFGGHTVCFISTELDRKFREKALSGYTTKNCKIIAANNKELKKAYRQLVVNGKAKFNDFGINARGSLTVSEDAKQIIEKSYASQLAFIKIFSEFEHKRHVYDVEISEIIAGFEQKLGANHIFLKNISAVIESSPEIPPEFKRRKETNALSFLVSRNMRIFDFFFTLKLLLSKPYRVSHILEYQYEITKDEEKKSFLKKVEFIIIPLMESLSGQEFLEKENIPVVADRLLKMQEKNKPYYTAYVEEEEKLSILHDLFTEFTHLEEVNGKKHLAATESQIYAIIDAIKRNTYGDLLLERFDAPKQKIKWNLSQKDVTYIFHLIKQAEYKGEKPWADIKIGIIMSKLFHVKNEQPVNEKSVINYISKFKNLSEPDLPKKSDDINKVVSKYVTVR